MAEWVHKGNLKGPQGDPGQDAQLPAGGTEGQVLTKTSGGEAWADVPQPDMTGVVTSSDGYLSVDGSTLDGVMFGTSSMSSYTNIKNTSSTSAVGAVSNGSAYLGAQSLTGGHSVELKAGSSESSLTIDSKSVTSITDAIADSPAGNALVTDKAVAGYVDAHGMPSVVPISRGGTGATTAEGARTALGIPDIEVATDEEFDSYMGLS